MEKGTRGKMKSTIFTIILLWFLILSNFAFAEMVTFGGSIFLDRSAIVGRLYIAKDNNIGVKIFAGHGLSDFSANFICSDKWNDEKVSKATRSISDYINNNSDINPFKMLSNAGLSGCKLGE